MKFKFGVGGGGGLDYPKPSLGSWSVYDLYTEYWAYQSYYESGIWSIALFIFKQKMIIKA